jgi:hypothetical protein
MTADFASIERDGWRLLSAEERHARHPTTFAIPDRARRDALSPGEFAKLLFDIETKVDGEVVDRGVDRMWVVVRRRSGDVYSGVLESDPGVAEGLALRPGDEVNFRAEHVCAIERPPDGYVVEKYGPGFFEP